MTNVMTKAGREQGTRNPACAGQGSGTLPLCTPGAEEEHTLQTQLLGGLEQQVRRDT